LEMCSGVQATGCSGTVFEIISATEWCGITPHISIVTIVALIHYSMNDSGHSLIAAFIFFYFNFVFSFVKIDKREKKKEKQKQKNYFVIIYRFIGHM